MGLDIYLFIDYLFTDWISWRWWRNEKYIKAQKI